jgi:glucosamine--fructose-6-phosphate aminotransferase (isomerizing)
VGLADAGRQQGQVLVEGIILEEIVAGPGAIRATLAETLPAARAAAADLQRRGVRRLYVIGNGTSFHSSLAVATLYRHLALPHEPALIPLTAAEFSTYLPSLGAGDAVLGISASGEFREVVAVMQALRTRVPTVAVVHVPGSTLTRLADHVLLTAGEPSRVPVMTKTFSCTLAATYLLIAELLGGERATQVEQAIAVAADDAEEAIRGVLPLVEGLAERFFDAEHIFVVGSGAAYPAALEAALKLKEMALVHAEGTETWEMESGAATLIGPATTVIGLEPAGRGREAVRELMRHCAEWGARCIEVTAEPALAGADVLPIPARADEEFASLVAVPPVALFAFLLARRRGLDPDRPAWSERYHSQGLTHIVGV